MKSEKEQFQTLIQLIKDTNKLSVVAKARTIGALQFEASLRGIKLNG